MTGAPSTTEGAVGGQGVQPQRAAARLAAVLYVLSGIVTLASPLLPAPPGLNHAGVAVIGVIAIAGGPLIVLIPWERWTPRAISVMLLPAFTLIGFHNYYGGIDPYRYGIFFLVAFAWLGLTQPRWMSLRFVPPFLVAYLVPLFIGDVPSWAWSSAVYTGAVSVLVAEALSYMTVQRDRALGALGRSERRFRSLVQNATDLITVIDPTGIVEYESPAASRILGLDPAERVGRNTIDAVHPADRDRIVHAVRGVSEADGRWTTLEVRMRHADGSWCWLEVTITNLLGEPAVRGLVVNSRDVTERRAVQDQLAHLAYHDSVTGLPNRAAFIERTERALGRARRNGSGVAVLFLDLDGFKVVNDSLGHDAGDQLLAGVAQRLAGSVRPTDTVARLGGDEFTVLFEDVTDEIDAPRTAERVLGVLATPFDVCGHRIVTSASIGIAADLAGTGDAGELLRHADLAMYMAKSRGRRRYETFDPVMGERAQARLQLEHDLRSAVEDRAFEVHYQPEMCLATGRVMGHEALVRWLHPGRGLLEPADFVPLAEETGVILAIGREVLHQACAEASSWASDDGGPAPFVSVNVSPRQLDEDDLVGDVRAALARSGLDPSRLTLEIGEGALMAGPAAPVLREIQALGVRLAIDDFGRGYSSLAHLKDLPIDLLKLDRSFVAGLGRSDVDAAIVAGVVSLAHAVGMTVIAEGVETPEQLSVVRLLGCDRAQGYFVGAPVPAHEVGVAAGATYRPTV